MSKPILVAIDGGSGNIAISFALNGELKTASIPSRIRIGNTQAYDSETNTTWRTVDAFGEEQLYSVVNRGVDLVDTCDPDYQVSAAHRVLVINALSQMGLGGKDIIIGETLPADQYYAADGGLNYARIEAKKASLMTPVVNHSKQLKAPNILGVKVYPEAVPAVFSASVLPDGSFDPRFERVRSKLVVDIGHFTCDIAYLDEDNNVVRKHTSENGVHILLKDIHAMLQNDAKELGIKDPKSISLDAIDRFIRDKGRIVSGWDDSESVNLIPYIEKATSNLTHRIKTDIRACWRDLTEVDVMLAVGGGANYVGGTLPYMKGRDLRAAWERPVFIPAYPEFAIVRGVYLSMSHAEDSLVAQFAKEV
ncbi:ParM/StbA family protein [Citrobacter freundii]|uniref:ParM/StbA family protein n=1 Tax=Citrobacter freundii TaxID=546 RepID=UPI001A2A57C3|nr:ParM/StbA family protein [Citrobacter freundii]MEB2478154.1 ParM/StbA family protein [Citrobacter freundii]HCD1268083.1 ParM/StbA family protein [Citrobacter freundii]